MKKTIKYRAWDKKEQKMITGRMATAIDIFSQSFAYRLKDVELMEYTNINDVNGKEIYEGDVVKYIKEGVTVGERRVRRGRSYDTYSIREDVEVVGTIEYGQFAKGIGNKFVNCFMIMTDVSASYASHFFSMSNKDKPITLKNNLSEPLYNDYQYEVIGNIYENSEYKQSN